MSLFWLTLNLEEPRFFWSLRKCGLVNCILFTTEEKGEDGGCPAFWEGRKEEGINTKSLLVWQESVQTPNMRTGRVPSILDELSFNVATAITVP